MLPIVVMMVAPAQALDADAPCEVVTPKDWSNMMDRIDAEFVRFRMDVVNELVAEAEQIGRCVEVVVPPSHVARFAQQKALAAFFAQDEEQAARWGQTAKAAMPEFPWPPDVVEGHPLHTLLGDSETPETSGPDGLTYPKGGGVFWNGTPLIDPKLPDGIPGLLQVADKEGKILEGYWQDGPIFREERVGKEKGETPKWFKPEDGKAAIAANQKWFADKGPHKLAAEGKKAAERCVLFTETGFTEMVRRGRIAVDYDDQEAYAEVISQLFRELPCLNAQIPKSGWATLLVELAIMEHRQGNQWMQPMQTALSINPDVPIGHAPQEIRNWAPPAPGPSGGKLPSDATFFVDGRLVTKVPDLPGLHAVQRFKNNQWETMLLRAEPFPKEWTVSDEVPPTTVTPTKKESPVQGVVALVGGFGSASQNPERQGADWIPEASAPGAVAGLSTTGRTKLDLPANPFWDITVPVHLGNGLHADAYAGAAIGPLLAGAGIATVPLTIGDEERTVVMVQPHIGAAVPAGPVFLTAAGGWSTAGLHAQASGLYSMGPMVVGLDAAYARAVFVENQGGGQIGVGRLRAGLKVGVAFGQGS